MYHIYISIRKFKQWWSTIPTISTKRTITSHLRLNSLNIKWPRYITL